MRLSSLLCAVGLAMSGCAAPPEEEVLSVACEGKCDGWGSIRSLLKDAKKLDLNDLISVGAGFASQELSDQLSSLAFPTIQISKPMAYALPERATQDLTLGNIDSLVAGLAARFGERELTTQVNAARRAHLQAAPGAVFAESAFRIDASVRPGWSLDADGIEDATVRLGFDAGAAIEARVIAAYGGEVSGLLTSPLAAVQETRGFILPRGIDDLRAMAPGESFALRGSGRIGLNLGAGVPLLLADPVSVATYRIVFSAALRTSLAGDVDVQLVRLGGDEVVLDVGVQRIASRSYRLAIEDRWGVSGLDDLNVELGSMQLGLRSVAERALSGVLNQKLNLIDAKVQGSSERKRVAVARFRFHLEAGASDEELAQAIAQALRGDVRLAQALANAGRPGVSADFDLSRSGASSTSYAGVDFLGMSFFRSVEQKEGVDVLQTPAGVRAFMFDSLHREAGWFFSSHGYTRVGLAGLMIDAAGGPAQSEANLVVQVQEGDKYMERDKLLDHLDGVIVGIAGPQALRAIEEPGNAIERLTESRCPPSSAAGAACLEAVLDDADVVQLRSEALDSLRANLDGLDPAQQELVMAAGSLRIAAQAAVEYAATFVGLKTSVVLDYRLDDKALGQVLREGAGLRFTDAVNAYLRAASVDRGDDPSRIERDRVRAVTDAASTVLAMSDLIDQHGDRFEKLSSAERASIETLGPIGARALEIRFPVSADNRPVYEEVAAQSIGRARMRAATELFDQLKDAASGLGKHAEQVVGYGLLGMTPRDQLDVRLDVKLQQGDWAYDHYAKSGYAPFDRYARGAAVSRINGGVFDVNAAAVTQ